MERYKYEIQNTQQHQQLQQHQQKEDATAQCIDEFSKILMPHTRVACVKCNR